eukprot:CAMPEP_0194046816 /NCGR_PEP_ID=MMETSP0009_2-20130614/22408_1 /TAXON_ID=210454 /ORGANISM="Grammatophora oceanica, Strain CCMP 410" /LENGTH=94 /DNA_ID=CAMNT_0038692247 /DNA_START=62 /DNA_END=346 /DNA_ORIENTATION=+
MMKSFLTVLLLVAVVDASYWSRGGPTPASQQQQRRDSSTPDSPSKHTGTYQEILRAVGIDFDESATHEELEQLIDETGAAEAWAMQRHMSREEL